MRTAWSLSLAGLLVSVLAAQSGSPARPSYGEPTATTFPDWRERTIHQLTNRARTDPAAELAACPAGHCLENACYSAQPPLAYTYPLNQAARFHTDSMLRMGFYGHNTPCTLYADIATRYPGTSDGSYATSCASAGSTLFYDRVALFGASFSGELLAAGFATAYDAFYGWLYETANTSACGLTIENGDRYTILANASPNLGVGVDTVSSTTYYTEEFGSTGAPIPTIPSASHWTSAGHLRDPAGGDTTIEFWANWYDAGGAPTQANLSLDGTPMAMSRVRGTVNNGAYFVSASGVGGGCHTYYFSFLDSGAQPMRYPTTGAFGIGSGCPDWSLLPPSAPTSVAASAASSTKVDVTWPAVSDATSYEVYRRDPGGSYTLVGTPTPASFSDTTVTADTAYLYRVRAIGAGGSSGDSPADVATTVVFTDDPLTNGTPIKGIHLVQVRTAVNAVRALANLSAASFTDPNPVGVAVGTVHVTELRSALDPALSALGLTPGGYTDVISPGVLVKAVHLQEIRSRVK